MADLIELDIVVKDKGLKQSVTTVERLERQIIRAAKAIDQNAISQERYNKILLSAKREYEAFGVSSQKATYEVRKFASAQESLSSASRKQAAETKALAAAQKQQAAETKALAAAEKDLQASRNKIIASAKQEAAVVDQLKGKYQAGYRELKLYKAESEQLNLAFQKNILTADQLRAEQDKLSAAFAKGTGMFSTYAQQMKNGANRAGVVMQQAGYQVGDFLVQVQSGTNAFVAFGQQATQMVGFLPMMVSGGAAATVTMFGLSASIASITLGLSIIIPLVTAAAAFLMRSGDAAKKASGSLDSYAEAMKSLADETANAQSKVDQFYLGVTSAAVAKAKNEIKDLEAQAAKARKEAEAAAKLLTSGVAGTGSIGVAFFAGALDSQAEAAQKKLDAINEELAARYHILRVQEGIAAAEDTAALENMINLNALGKIREDLLAKQQRAVDLDKQQGDKVEELYGKVVRVGAELLNISRIQLVDVFTRADTGANKLLGTLSKMFAKMQSMAQFGQNYADMGGGRYVDRNKLYANMAGRGGTTTSTGSVAGVSETKNFLLQDLEKVKKATKGLSKEQKDLLKAAEDLRKELEGPMVSAINGVSNAFGDFISNGLKDFKGFTKSILNSFKGMISQMISTAMSNKIMLSVGMGGSGLATQAAAGQLAGVGSAGFGGPMGGLMGTFGGGGAAGTGLLGGLGTAATGLGTGFMSSVYGGIGGMTGAVSGGLSMGGLAGISTAIGAIAAPLLAVAAVFSFFKKKTKELDSGLRITVTNMDALVNTFQTVQTKKFWGLSKKTTTTESAASSDIANPIVKAVQDMQTQMVKAADMFGISSDAFDNFAYNFELSLKGLTEEQKAQKLNEELAKMGDSFASLTGHFQTMNELLEAANQRVGLQNRLDQLLGNNAAILARQREAELAALHELNRPLAQAIYGLEDAQAAVANAFTSLSTSIEAEKNRLRDAFTSIVDGLKERLDAANASMSRSNSIYSMLEGAVSGRSVTSGLSQAFSRREGAMGFIRGGNFSDEKKLEQALNVVSEPTENLFGSFVEYARDFGLTSRTLQEAKDVAQVQLTADEKSVLLLEDQITQAQTNLDAQLEALDKQYQTEVDQYNALLGIDTSVKSVNEAIGTLSLAIQGLMSAKAAAQAAADMASAGASAGVSSGGSNVGVQAANSAGAKILEQLGQSGIAKRASDGANFQQVNIRGTQQLLDMAKQLGVQTSGQTGAQIQQALSNAGNLGVSLDDSTRAKQFAMGGYHNGGMRLVGERGPELEATGPSRIFSHTQTGNMFRDPDLKDAVRSLKDEVSGLRSEQRQIQMDISKYTKRSYDIERKWDVEGLPATRV